MKFSTVAKDIQDYLDLLDTLEEGQRPDNKFISEYILHCCEINGMFDENNWEPEED